MKTITLNQMVEYNYAPEHCVFAVKNGNAVLGIVEHWEGEDTWKAFLGSGFSCKYLAKYYSRRAAVAAIVKMAANLE